MKIRKLGDDLFKSYRGIFGENEARIKTNENIEKIEGDLLFMQMPQQEIIDFRNFAKNWETQDILLCNHDFRFESSRPRDKRESMEMAVGENGMDELDYANMAPDRWKNYYYDQSL